MVVGREGTVEVVLTQELSLAYFTCWENLTVIVLFLAGEIYTSQWALAFEGTATPLPNHSTV